MKNRKKNPRLRPTIIGLSVLIGVVIGIRVPRESYPALVSKLDASGAAFLKRSKAVAGRLENDPKPPEEMAALSGGVFVMGDGFDKMKDAPLHQVHVDPFLIDCHEVTLKLWDSVVQWALKHGYRYLPAGQGKQASHPVYAVAWMEAICWCNARSEMEGLVPCYYADHSLKVVLRSCDQPFTSKNVSWEANGYRLPTEAEWEFAARGGLRGKRFPWGDRICHADANYFGSMELKYDASNRAGVAAPLATSLPHTASVGSFPPNSFGLYDMAGNVAEWCWDVYDVRYGIPKGAMPDITNNPRGPESGEMAVVRGGSWRHLATEARCAARFYL